ncbi:hypothetical protein [Streptomyces sp. NPDC059460]
MSTVGDVDAVFDVTGSEPALSVDGWDEIVEVGLYPPQAAPARW